MKQWEIYDFPSPSEAQPHPFVVLSPTVLAEHKDYKEVNALMCVSLRGGAQPKVRDVRLNGSDGLDGPTLVQCHFIHTFQKSKFGRRRGVVSLARQRAIGKTLALVFNLTGV